MCRSAVALKPDFATAHTDLADVGVGDLAAPAARMVGCSSPILEGQWNMGNVAGAVATFPVLSLRIGI